jgi:hypothetical protein
MSGREKHRIGNLLFWFQIICAFIFCGSQALKMLESTQGVSLSFFICHGIFALLNLSLAVVAMRESGSGNDRQIKKQSVFIYSMWTVFLAIHLSIAIWKMPRLWKHTDTVAISLVTLGVLIIISIAKAKRLPLTDSYVKAGLAIFFKSVPQVALAYSISVYGKGGLSGVWILFGHITILTRLVHLWVSNREQWNRNTRGSFVSEVWNEGSWLAASAAWLYF